MCRWERRVDRPTGRGSAAGFEVVIEIKKRGAISEGTPLWIGYLVGN